MGKGKEARELPHLPFHYPFLFYFILHLVASNPRTYLTPLSPPPLATQCAEVKAGLRQTDMTRAIGGRFTIRAAL